MAKYQKAFYRIGQGAGLVLVGAWFWFGGREMNFVTWPRVPQPEIGRTIPHQTKGITVYIAKADQEIQRRLAYVMIGAGIVTFFCLFPSGEFRRLYPKREPPKSNQSN